MALLWWPESCFQVPSHFLQHFTTAQVTTYAAIAWRDGIEVAQEPATHFSIHITFLLIMSSRLKRQDLKKKIRQKTTTATTTKTPLGQLCAFFWAPEKKQEHLPGGWGSHGAGSQADAGSSLCQRPPAASGKSFCVPSAA